MKRIRKITILIPKQLQDKKIRQLRIIPQYHGSYFAVEFSYEDKEVNQHQGEGIMVIDFGVSNLATIVTSNNQSFIIDGKRLKSINRLFNKKISYYNSKKKAATGYSKRQLKTLRKRNLRVDSYIHKVSRMIINIAKDNNIGTIAIGYNKGIKDKGVKNKKISNKQKAVINQNFIGLPLFKLKNQIIDKGERINMKVILQEESYTSKCSFYDQEEVCYHEHYLGKRKGRLFYTSKEIVVNADVNGALNILSKCKLKDSQLDNLRSSGLTIPVRLNAYENKKVSFLRQIV